MHNLILANFAMHITLEPHEQEQALVLLQQKTVAKRTFLLQPGEVDRNIYFVTKGCLRMYYTDQTAQDHNICFYPKNWWACYIVSFFKEKPAINAIQALEDSEVSYFALTQLEELFASVPKFERFFASLLKTVLNCISAVLLPTCLKMPKTATGNFASSIRGWNIALPKNILLLI